MSDIEYKTTKAMFSINKISEVETTQIKDSDINVNQEEMKQMLENFSELEEQEDTNTLANPLFANPVNNA